MQHPRKESQSTKELSRRERALEFAKNLPKPKIKQSVMSSYQNISDMHMSNEDGQRESGDWEVLRDLDQKNKEYGNEL